MPSKGDRVRPTFEAFTRNEFPDVTWQGFLDQLQNLGDVLKAMPVRSLRPSALSSPVTVLPKLHDIARRSPLDVLEPAP